jgi:hypothetical protein
MIMTKRDITRRIARQQIATDALESRIHDAHTVAQLSAIELQLRQTEVGGSVVRGRLLGLLRLRRKELEAGR